MVYHVRYMRLTTQKRRKRIKRKKKAGKQKYLFFNKLTLELVGVLKTLTIDLDSGTVTLSDITETLLLQLHYLWDLV